jgi:hypothetical protein
MEEKKIDIKVDEEVARGHYSNVAAIRHTREEFIFDLRCLSRRARGPVALRLILSPAHAKRFMEALQANILRYEENFGAIVPSGPRPSGSH